MHRCLLTAAWPHAHRTAFSTLHAPANSSDGHLRSSFWVRGLVAMMFPDRLVGLVACKVTAKKAVLWWPCVKYVLPIIAIPLKGSHKMHRHAVTETKDA